MNRKKILVAGGAGFIGSHLVKRLKDKGHLVVVADIKSNEFHESEADFFIQHDLCNQLDTYHLFKHFKFDEVMNLAAIMGGMEFLANGVHDYEVLGHSSLICHNVMNSAIDTGVSKIFFSSSACVYPEHLQMDANVTALKESDAYPANCDLEYGYQKLITERLYMAGERCTDIKVRIARFHNVYGSWTEWQGEKAKAPAAICRKVAQAIDGTHIEVFGDGKQTRSFMHVDDCVEGIIRLMNSGYNQPVNIGSSELIAINDLANMIIDISGKDLDIVNVDGPQGVRGRNSDNTLIRQQLNWEPTIKLQQGISTLYNWVSQEVTKT